MNPQLFILTALYDAWRPLTLYDDYGSPKWGNRRFVRGCMLRLERGDESAWPEFVKQLETDRELAGAARSTLIDALILLEVRDWNELEKFNQLVCDPSAWLSLTRDRGPVKQQLNLPPTVAPFFDTDEAELLRLLDERYREQITLAHYLEHAIPQTQRLSQPRDAKTFIAPTAQAAGEIRYIEMKPDLSGPARIGRVTFSKTRKSIYYDGKTLQSLKGKGYKANFYNVETAMWYWVSKCRKDGNDRLYPGVIEIDDDVREEYWTEIRKQPENKRLTQFRSSGKHSKRRPA